jgi:mycothiol system anti-sigma-R factor
MADCEDTLHELYAYLDGELGLKARSHVQEHLDSCLDCLQAFDFHAELRVVIAQKCRGDEIPPGLLDRVKACFGDEVVAPPVAEPGEAPPPVP